MFEEMSSSFRILSWNISAFAHFSVRDSDIGGCYFYDKYENQHFLKIILLAEKRAKAELCHNNILKLEDICSNIVLNFNVVTTYVTVAQKKSLKKHFEVFSLSLQTGLLPLGTGTVCNAAYFA